jgi:hypothetical protein
MTHGGLRGSRRNSAFAQERAERRSKGVNVNRSAPIVGLGTDQQIGASFDRLERAISAVLMLASSSEAHF